MRRKIVLMILAIPVAVALPLACGDDDDNGNGSGEPTKIIAVNGTWYTSDVGSSTLDTDLVFAVENDDGDRFPNRTINLTLVEGDGTLTPAAGQVTTGADGTVQIAYEFTGALGHAVVRASATGLTAAQANLRDNRLIYGSNPQVQYVLLNEDLFAEVQALNGPPERIDTSDQFFINVAVYEQQKGVVFIFADDDQDLGISVDDPIIIGIVNANEDQDPTNDYPGTTAEGIGIGDSISTAFTAFGPFTRFDSITSPPPVYLYEWGNKGLTVLTTYEPDVADRTIVEMQFVDPTAPTPVATATAQALTRP